MAARRQITKGPYGAQSETSAELTVRELRGKLRALRHVAIPHGADHYWLTQAAQREALLLGLQPPALIQLSGEVPPALTKPASSDKHIATAALGVAA